jgi:hypothetical protein
VATTLTILPADPRQEEAVSEELKARFGVGKLETPSTRHMGTLLLCDDPLSSAKAVVDHPTLIIPLCM